MGRTRNTPEERAKRLVSMKRAGKRKCGRCKNVFYKPRGELKRICPRCRTRCSRCDVEFTEKNTYITKGKQRSLCRTCHLECARATIGNNGFNYRDNHLIKTYGITSIEYDTMFSSQKGGCFICHKSPKKNKLAVDHLHAKGERKRNPREIRGRVRGLLCWGCNRGLGYFRDDITRLRRAADYLEQWPAQRVLNKEKTNGSQS